MSTKTIIRKCRPRSDHPEIIRLIHSELMPLSHTADPRDPKHSSELPKRLREGNTFVVSRTETSKPLGFLHLYLTGQIAFFDMLAIHPAHRGKQLGQLLMSYGETYARSQHCTRARLFIDEGNDSAYRLYTKLGYTITGYYPNLRCYEMQKSIVQQA